jgi:cytochrome c
MEDGMKKRVILLTALLVAGALTLAHAANVDHGKALFESPKLGNGTNGRSCSVCHAGGRKLGHDLFERKQFNLPGMGNKGLADMINFCIKNSLGGTPIDPQGQDMQDLMAYMKTLVTPPAK